MIRRMLLFVFASFLLVTAQAQAGWKVDRAVQIANIVWNYPCSGHVRLQWEAPPANQPTLQNANAWEQNCVVTYNVLRPTTWGEFCTDTIHEFGHAANFRDPTNKADPLHSANPRSVMYGGEYTELPLVEMHPLPNRMEQYEQADSRCELYGRPYLAKRGATLLGRAPHSSVTVTSYRKSGSGVTP